MIFRYRLFLTGILTTLILTTSNLLAGTYDDSGIPELPGNPSLNKFPICFKHTCEAVKQLSLSPKEWSKVKRVFRQKAKSPQHEHRLIKKAVAKLEQIIGVKTNTSQDKGGNFSGMFADGLQMDCIDESSNTTTYLALMQKDKLLKWHKVQPTKTRGFFIFGMPHTTAVIKENKSGKLWAVDSWFHDNGVEPEIVPISKWKSGWEPEKK